MRWTQTQQFHPWPFDKDAELETTIAEVKTALFGESRIYLDVKRLIGEQGRTLNIPDGYLLDLSSPGVRTNAFAPRSRQAIAFPLPLAA